MTPTSPIEAVKGVGPATASKLRAGGITTVADLLYLLPRRYDDFSAPVPIAQVRPGLVTIRARCHSVTTRTVRRGLQVTNAVLVDNSGQLRAVWFNQPYRASQLQKAGEVLLSGQFELQRGRYHLTNPNLEPAGKSSPGGRIVPIYRQVGGLSSAMIRSLLRQLRPLMASLPEALPPAMVAKYSLISHADALVELHFPRDHDRLAAARRRFGFAELLPMLLAAYRLKATHAQLQGYALPPRLERTRAFVDSLPFSLTDDQRRAAWDILQDMAANRPMNRLLQGDVGAGKTVVAALAAHHAAGHQYQTALMAPTDVLARQHAQTLTRLLTPHGIKVGLLTGSVTGQDRHAISQAIADGQVMVVVGTHALFQDAVRFARLGLVVIDEQHRFGVGQRQRLLDKADHSPHLLAMTATPIPRSLALTVYGELDLSLVRQKPAGRRPIITQLVVPAAIDRTYRAIKHELAAGHQAYIICPLIDDNPDNDQKSVEAEHARLARSVFRTNRIGLLHGKLPAQDKTAVLQRFAEGQLDILISTTVVEVGVDAPNATVMVIENADRFGLSQLHQLRGRVGRSSHQSYCYLVLSDHTPASPRLRAIEQSDDGFYLAETDLRLRGAGEIYGRAQHGPLNLRVARLTDSTLVNQVAQAAKAFVASGDNLLHYKELADQVEYYQRLTRLN